MKRRRLGVWRPAVVLTVALVPAAARAQSPVGRVVAAPAAYRMNPYYAAPGSYGMMLGTPSYGSVRTYSEFSSPYGAGYNYGYGPSRFLPGRYGVGLWRPGFVTPGFTYGASYDSYRTFAVGTPGAPPPGVGVYAPAFGPATMDGW